MAKISRYDGATDGDPLDWLAAQYNQYGWAFDIRLDSGTVRVLMTRNTVEHAASASITTTIPAALKEAVESVSDAIVTDLQDLAS